MQRRSSRSVAWLIDLFLITRSINIFKQFGKIRKQRRYTFMIHPLRLLAIQNSLSKNMYIGFFVENF